LDKSLKFVYRLRRLLKLYNINIILKKCQYFKIWMTQQMPSKSHSMELSMCPISPLQWLSWVGSTSRTTSKNNSLRRWKHWATTLAQTFSSKSILRCIQRTNDLFSNHIYTNLKMKYTQKVQMKFRGFFK
jgi:hypothetical protein